MTQIQLPLLRNSERHSFKTCPFQWQLGWQRGLKPAMARTDARWFGTMIHLALAEYYTPPGGRSGFARGADPLETWEKLTADAYAYVSSGAYFDDSKEAEFYDAAKLGQAMLSGYMKKWKDDDRWEVLMPESRFKTMIPFTRDQIARRKDFLDGKIAFKYITELAGTFDMPIRDYSFPEPTIMVVDHKTTNKKENVKYLVKDDQAGTYISVSTAVLRANGLIGEKEYVKGAIFNYLRKAFPKDDETRDEQGRVRNKPKKEHYVEAFAAIDYHVPPRTSLAEMEKIAAALPGFKVYGDISKNQGVDLFWRIPVMRSKASRLRQIRRIAEDAELIGLAKQGEIPILKNPGDHCNWCDFNDLCDLDENGDDTEGFIEALYTQVDMYADHRDGAINSKESAEAFDNARARFKAFTEGIPE